MNFQTVFYREEEAPSIFLGKHQSPKKESSKMSKQKKMHPPCGIVEIQLPKLKTQTFS